MLVATIKAHGRLLLGLLSPLQAIDALIEGAVRNHDPIIVLGVLQITFRSNPIARGIGIARQLTITIEDMRGGATNLHVRAATIEITLAAAAAPTHLMGFATAA